jgi:hypothetical protein
LNRTLLSSFVILCAAACAPPAASGLRLADPGTGAQVQFDVTAKPFPNIPFPNDVATRYDPTSPTGLRVNASMIASTTWEEHTRQALDSLDGWGTYSPITVAFDKPLDPESVYAHHSDDYDFSDDVVYVIDVSPDSPDFCQAVPLDMGKGNFPLYLQRQVYYPNDPRANTNNLVFEEVEEDLNRDNNLDPGEDTDADGVLDHPNVRMPGGDPVDYLLPFYERQTNTLIIRPIMPLREETTYAAVLMRGLLDESGRPVRSPFQYINHTQQTQALQPLEGCLNNYGRTLDQVAFTWAFTTQSISRDFVAIRDGLNGLGSMAWLKDQFPAELSQVMNLRTEIPGGPVITNLKVVTEAEFEQVLPGLLPLLFSGGTQDPTVQAILESRKFVGYHVIGQFVSPQFFPRAPDGVDDSTAKNWLPLYDQIWHVDPMSGQAYVRPETVTFWINIPKYAKQPMPVAILGHGYTGDKTDPLAYGGYFARQGVATIGMECVSHGLPIDASTHQLVDGLFAPYGLQPMADALLTDRAYDQNGDGIKDSGADFWTAYVFHTRDVVRQSAVDYMRMIQILRSFNGRKWTSDLMHTGTPGVAGDFDGDGIPDVGGSAPILMTGGSLGGIMSTVMGGAEPSLSAVVPVSGGAGLSDIGIRSIQGGVAEAVNLRTFGPLVVTIPEGGGMGLWEYLPDLNAVGTVRLGLLQDPLNPGDTALLRNLRSGEWGCGPVQPGGLIRTTVSADQGDPLQLEIYAGPLQPSYSTGGCTVPDGVSPRTVFNTLQAAVTFQWNSYPQGSPMIAFGDGFGLKRGTPDMRQFMQIAQMVLDPGDPANYAPNFERRLLKYGTGEEVHTRALVVNSIGDMNVPMNTGAAIARAAGFLDFTNKDPRYNKTPNQLLIDLYSLEAANRANRYINAEGVSVLWDLEYLSSTAPGESDGWDVPRLNPPLRLVGPSTRVGGVTGVLFPMSKPTGQHGFNLPDPTLSFDPGRFMVNSVAHYLATSGMDYSFDGCQADSSCPWIPPVPPN